MMTNYSIILCTTNSNNNAKEIANSLVSEKLCACVNIIPKITSIYSWENQIEESEEYLLLIKAKKELYTKIEARIKALHSYKIPEIVALSIDSGSNEYLNWINNSTI